MPGIYLQFVSATGKDGKVLKLPGIRFVLGRSASADVRLKSAVASRKHAVVEMKDGIWEIRDLGSRNGLIVNKTRVDQTELRPLDTVQLGVKGPRIRILSLEPAPPMQGSAADSTRMFRAPGAADLDWPPKPPRAPPDEEEEEELEAIPIAMPEPLPRRPAPAAPRPPTPEEEHTTAEVRAGGRGWLVVLLAVLGAGFGGVTAYTVWPEWWFPYEYVLAPVLWAIQGIAEVLPPLRAEVGEWVARGLCVAWFALFFLFFARPLRWLLWILILAAIHGAAIFFLDGTLR